MDIGSGLIVQTRTVNGKPSAGIFLNTDNNISKKNQNQRDKTKTKQFGKYPVRSRVEPIEKQKNGNVRNKNLNTKNEVAKSHELKSTEKANTGQAPNERKKSPVTTNVPLKKSNGETQKQRPVAVTTKKNAATRTKGDKIASEGQEVNTKFVTLTQGQLNTILSLVKSKNEVDITNVLEDKDEKPELKKEDESTTDGDKKMPENGESEKSKSRPNSVKSTSGKNDQENIANLLKNKGEKVDENSSKIDDKDSKTSEKSSRENSDVEKRDSSSGRRSEDDLPAAIRSSFFLGEAAPREHAFSAKKREEQLKWREELDKQRLAQREKKEQERNARRKTEADESWNKHFDTMLPAKNSPRQSQSESTNFINENHGSEINNSQQSELEKTSTELHADAKTKTSKTSNASNIAPMPSAGITDSKTELSSVNQIATEHSGNGDFPSILPTSNTTNALPQRSSYLRTMTSLLDPAQLEALELKRQKQEEHRKAIAAQVEERKRKKEDEEMQRRRYEMEEDQRLAAEQALLTQKNEVEKLRNQMQENARERKTRELYQQMKDAQESALRDKLSRREQNLRNKGHDTSRLERTHQLTLETTRKPLDNPLAQISQTSISSNTPVVTGLALPQDGFHGDNNISPRQILSIGDNRVPLAVTAQTEQGPIKLEISLNQRQSVDLVESAVQTDERITDPRQQYERIGDARLGYDSDADTEYMQLPNKQRNNLQKFQGKNRKLQNFEKDLDRQYDRHSRNVGGGQPRQKKNEKRPKWGVGEKNKNFIPASQRYTEGQQKHEALMRKQNETHVITDPERSRVISHSPRWNPAAEQRSKSPVIPTVRNRQNKDTSKRQTANVPKTSVRDRPNSGIFATTDQAKYRSEKHSRHSPVPETTDFVQYRRTSAILDPSQVPSRPETGPMQSRTEFVSRQERGIHGETNDPLLNPNIARQHDRQDQILKEISILRQGLLIKQREVASYPAAMTHSMAPTNFVLAAGGNLPERTNDTPIM